MSSSLRLGPQAVALAKNAYNNRFVRKISLFSKPSNLAFLPLKKTLAYISLDLSVFVSSEVIEKRIIRGIGVLGNSLHGFIRPVLQSPKNGRKNKQDEKHAQKTGLGQFSNIPEKSISNFCDHITGFMPSLKSNRLIYRVSRQVSRTPILATIRILGSRSKWLLPYRVHLPTPHIPQYKLSDNCLYSANDV